MQVQVVVLPTGEIGIFTQEGTFVGGEQVIERILRHMRRIGTETYASNYRLSKLAKVGCKIGDSCDNTKFATHPGA